MSEEVDDFDDRAKVEFWTVWGSLDTVCSKHQTLKAAVRAVKECERRGGAHHRILCVQEFLRGERRSEHLPSTP